MSAIRTPPCGATREAVNGVCVPATIPFYQEVNVYEQSEKSEAKKPGQSDELVALALNRFRIGRTNTGVAFAVPRHGPNIIIPIDGAKNPFRRALACEFREVSGRVPNSKALGDALTVLQGMADQVEAEAVHLRVAEYGDAVVIDLGDKSGRAVVVSAGSWNVVERSPVVFRRTNATGALPTPERNGDLSLLRDFLNVTDETWPLGLGWLVAAFIPEIPHPIGLLSGQQGTGKSSTARRLVDLVDPSPAALRSQPRNEEQWAVSANASWVVALDNISAIPPWFADAMCKACTGDGYVSRTFYTNDEPNILSFRRALLLTSIDAGAMRGDFGDRVLFLDLEPIEETQRREERVMDADWDMAKPRLLGAMLDLLADVLAALPTVKLDRLPRMADFARLLTALDRVSGSKALDTYLSQQGRIAETVIDGDPVAMALINFLEKCGGTWEGTATELLNAITPDSPPKNWPSTPGVLSGRIARVEPDLKRIGTTVDRPRSGQGRKLVIRRGDVAANADGGAA